MRFPFVGIFIMKDKEWLKEKTKVKKIFHKWIEILGLRWYGITFVWKSGDAPDRGDNFICLMECRSKWEYRQAHITIWLEELLLHDESLEKNIVHELCHIFTEQMRGDNGVTKQEEYLAENLARAFMWVAEGKKKK